MSHERRLRTVARRAKLCSTHLVKLQCHSCTTRWTGTAEAWDELAELLGKVNPHYPPLRPHGQCDLGHDLICELCWQQDARVTMHVITEDVISIPEIERMTLLLKSFKRL